MLYLFHYLFLHTLSPSSHISFRFQRRPISQFLCIFYGLTKQFNFFHKMHTAANFNVFFSLCRVCTSKYTELDEIQSVVGFSAIVNVTKWTFITITKCRIANNALPYLVIKFIIKSTLHQLPFICVCY